MISAARRTRFPGLLALEGEVTGGTEGEAESGGTAGRTRLAGNWLERFVDQSGAALIREIVPQPVERHDEALPRSYQVVDMGKAPEYPRNEAGQAKLPNRDDGRFSANSREITIVPVFER